MEQSEAPAVPLPRETVDTMSQVNNALGHPIITGRPDTVGPTTRQGTAAPSGPSFQELLEKSLQGRKENPQLTFSRHAQQRTIQRNIELSEADLSRLGTAVGKAEDKGLKDTLVFMDSTAFIVNVPNRVVVTVVDSDETENTVFTNIDGAVIV